MPVNLEKLWRKAASGDQVAFRSLYEVVTPWLYKLIRKEMQIPDQSTADDLVQEAWIKILRGFSPDRGPLIPFARLMSRNVFVDLIRRIRHLAPLPDEGIPGSTESFLEYLSREENQQRLYSCLDKLDEDRRLMIALRFWESLRMDDIGKRVGKTGTSVRGHLSRAIVTLRRCMGFPDSN